MRYANFTDDDVPAEAPHTADHLGPLHAFADAGTGPRARFIIAAFDDRDDAQADGRWLACAEGDVVEVRE